MADEALYELHNRKGLFNIGVIFVAVVMEGDKVPIIFVNPGRGNNGASKIAPNVFYGGFGFTFIWLCIDIETVFVFPVTAGLYLFKRRADSGFHFIQQGSAESIAEEGIAEVAGSAFHGIFIAAGGAETQCPQWGLGGICTNFSGIPINQGLSASQTVQNIAKTL